MLPVDHNQTRTGFGNGQVGLSDCPAARDIPSAPPPAFSRGVCGAVPPARVCPTAAVAGFEKVLVDQQPAFPTLPALRLSEGWLALDRHCRLSFGGRAIRDLVPVGLVLVGRESGLDGAGVRTKEDAAVQRLQIRHSGERPGVHQ